MVIQCDQCNTKFKLDDSKLKDEIVKVRCSKCKHIFEVRRDSKHEEPDFESILSGLGTSSTGANLNKSSAESSHVTSVDSETDNRDVLVDEGIKMPSDDIGTSWGATFSGAMRDGVSANGVSPQVGAEHGEMLPEPSERDPAPVTGVISGNTDSQIGDSEFNFDGFNMSDANNDQEPSAGKQESASEFNFEDFSFSGGTQEDTLNGGQDIHAPSVLEQTGKFDSHANPSESKEMSFSVPPLVGLEKTGHGLLEKGQTDEFGYGDSDKSTSSASSSNQVINKKPDADAFDFGSFDFTESSLPDSQAGKGDVVPEPSQNAIAPAVESHFEVDSFDFGSLDFGAGTDEMATETGIRQGAPPVKSLHANSGGTIAPEAEAYDFGKLDFGETDSKDSRTGSIPAVSSEILLAKKPVEEDSFDFGNFDLHQNTSPENDSNLGSTFSADLKGNENNVAPDDREVSTSQAMDEEVPPLTISTRRKGGSTVPIAVLTIGILLIAVIVGGGYYFVKKGPAVLNDIGLGFVAKWIGVESVEEGKITLKLSTPTFIVNQEGAELFVVNGEAVNNYKKPRASIQVKAVIYGVKGDVLMQKTAYCGNTLTTEQLKLMPIVKIDSAMNNQFGDSLANLGVQPGKSIPFTIVIANVPREVKEFGVEVVGSTVSSQ
jgi:predicted Zn finger-like uncharacterized protein